MITSDCRGCCPTWPRAIPAAHCFQCMPVQLAVRRISVVSVRHSQGDAVRTLPQVSLEDAPMGPGKSCGSQPELNGQQRSFAALLLAMWLVPAVSNSRCVCVVCQLPIEACENSDAVLDDGAQLLGACFSAADGPRHTS
jgi:hypothetical protein